MATTKKSATKSSAAPTTAALANGAHASGAKQLKKGFALSPEMDLAFALGWPNMMYLADGHPDDDDPAAFALENFRGGLEPLRRVWPREGANRILRIWARPSEQRYGVQPNGEFGMFPAVGEAANTPGPLSREEVAAVVHHGFRIKDFGGDVFAKTLSLLEAVVGPDVVVEHALSALEALDPSVFVEREDTRFQAILSLGFMLLRVPEEEARDARARLEKLFQRTVASLPGGSVPLRTGEEQFPPYRALDLILHGRVAAERSGAGVGKCPRQYMLWVDDDPVWLLQALREKPDPRDSDAPPNARLVFLAGDHVLDIERQYWKRYSSSSDDHQEIVATYTAIRSEKMVLLMVEMSAAGKAKKQALEWLKTHSNYARPFVEAAAKASGAVGEAAKAALAKM